MRPPRSPEEEESGTREYMYDVDNLSCRMTDGPLISIVTPSYNQVEFIEDTIRSVRRQSYDNVEHIVIDGKSTDGTVDILKEHDHIEFISEPDDGQADAINKGFEMANGDIVGWLNSDDVYFDTSVFDRVVRYFDDTGSDIVYGDMALIDEDSEVLKVHCPPDFDAIKLLRYCFITQPSLFFASNVIGNNRLNEDLEYVMDYEFWLRLSREYEFTHVNDVLSGDRNHSGRKIIANRDQMRAEMREIQQQYGVRRGRRFEFDRQVSKLTSGLPRRLKSVKQTLRFHHDPPDFAFDGELKPQSAMVRKTLQPNHELV